MKKRLLFIALASLAGWGIQTPAQDTNAPGAPVDPLPPAPVATNLLPLAEPAARHPAEPAVDPELRKMYLGEQGSRLGSPRGARELETEKGKRPDRAWHGEVEVGGTTYRGNADSDLVLLKLRSERTGEASRFRLGAHGAWGNSEGERSRENAGAEAGYRHDLRGRFYYATEARYFYDALADLDYQAVGLVSLGYDVVKEKDTLLALETGPAYIVERKGGEQKDFLAMRVGFSVEHLIQEQVLLWQRAEYLPALDDPAVYLVTAEVGVESVLSAWLRFRTVVQQRYDSDPAEDKEKGDLFMSVSLVAVY